MADTTDTPSLQQLTSMSPKGTGFKDFQSFMQPFNQNAERAAKEKSQMEGEKEAFAAQQQSAGAEQKSGLLESTNKSMADLPRRQERREVSEAMGKPFVPTKDNAQDLAGLFSLINVVGFALGRGGKNNSVQALSAMNGMAEGWNKGRDDLYKKEKATFDENLKQLKMRYDSLTSELKEDMDLLARDYEAGKLKIDATLSKQSASFLQDMAHKYGYARMYEYYTDAQKSAEKMWEEYSKIQDRAQTHEMERQRLGIEQQRIELEKKKAQPGELGSGAYLLRTIGVAAKNDKDNKAIVDNSKGIAGINKTIEEFRDPDVKTGVESRLSNIREAIKSLGPQTELTDDQINSLINGAVDPAGKNAVAIKDALFNAFAIERAAQGGRVTVQMMNVGGSALNPASYVKDDYIAVLGKRRDDLYQSLHGMGLNNNQIGSIVTDLQQNAPALYNAPKQELSDKDKEALDWANSNPTDPRAAQIKKRLGVQ